MTNWLQQWSCCYKSTALYLLTKPNPPKNIDSNCLKVHVWIVSQESSQEFIKVGSSWAQLVKTVRFKASLLEGSTDVIPCHEENTWKLHHHKSLSLSFSCRLHPTKSWRVRKLKTKKDSIRIYIYIYLFMIVYSHMTYHTSWRESISACTKLHASKAARLKEVAEMGTEAMPHEAGYSGSVSSLRRSFHSSIKISNEFIHTSSYPATSVNPIEYI